MLHDKYIVALAIMPTFAGGYHGSTGQLGTAALDEGLDDVQVGEVPHEQLQLVWVYAELKDQPAEEVGGALPQHRQQQRRLPYTGGTTVENVLSGKH